MRLPNLDRGPCAGLARFLLALVFLAASNSALADRFARITMNWSASTWSATSCVAGANTAAPPGVADNVTICTGATVTQNVAAPTINTLNVIGTLNAGANTITIDNTTGFTLNAAGTFNAGTSTVVFNNPANTTLTAGAAIQFYNVTINPAPGGTPRTYTFGAAAITINNNFLINVQSTGGTRAVTVEMGAGGITVTNNTTIQANGNETANLDTNGFAFTSGRLIVGTLGTFTAAAATVTLNATSGTLLTRTGTFTAGTSIVVMNPASGSPTLTSGTFLTTNAFNSLTVNMAGQTGTLGAAITVNNTLLVSAGTLSNNNFAITSDGASTFQVNDGATFAMTGTSVFPPTSGGTHFSTFTFQCGAYPSCSTVSYRQTTNPLTLTNVTYGHLDLAPAGTATQRFSAGTWTINGNLGVGDGTNTATADAATNSVTLDVNGGVTIAASGTLQAHATNAFNVARNWTNNGTFTHSSGTVTLDGATGQTVGGTSTTTFRNLTITNTSTAPAVTAGSNFTVNATLTLNASTSLADGGNTISVNGDVANSGTHSGTGKILLTGGAAAHTLAGSGSYTNLELNDATNGAVLSANATVNGTLTFINGNLGTTSVNTLTIGSAGTISGAAASRHVTGNLARAFSAANAFTYAIGDGTNYTPLAVTFSAAVTGNLTAAVTNTDHPNTTGVASGIDASKSINRYWTLKSSTISGTYSAALTYIDGTPVDRDSGAVAASFVVRRGATCSGSGVGRTCASWASLTVSPVPNNTLATATGVSISSGDPESDFVVGEVASTRFTREKEFIYTRELY